MADLERFAEKGAAGAVMRQLGAMIPMSKLVSPVGPEVANGHLLPAAEVGGVRGAA